jgi:hypothetical protein
MLLALAVSACSAARGRPGTAEARGSYYADNVGLSVVTAGASVDQPVSRDADVFAHGVFDHLRIVPRPATPSTSVGGNQSTGHAPHDGDIISGASARIAGGAVTEKSRVEGLLGGRVAGSIADAPASIAAQVRVSSEPDYLSASGLARGRVDLFERNLTATGFLGYGHDTVSPLEPPPGQASLWPAVHQRVNGGLTLSQIVSRTMILSGGFAGAHQFGVLASPYRRALIRTTLFPEVVPSVRNRYTAFTELSWYVGFSAAVHLRQGLYLDSWGVVGIIPEATFAKELGEKGLLMLRYRFYRQSAASFYRARRDDIEAVMSSDPRLGRAREHAPGLALRWTVFGERGGFGALTLDGSYDLSVLDYEDAGLSAVIGHVFGIGAVVSY